MEKKERVKKEEVVDVVGFVRSRLFSYIMFTLSLIVCFYTIYNVQDWQMKIDDAWIGIINEHCSCSSFYKPNISFVLQTPKEMIESSDREFNNTLCFIGGQVRPLEDCEQGVDISWNLK